ncbi:outer membrane beta-barrel protein [Fulvivirga sp. 29W222]|uniref:Outer membrane beta-barrel protein n=1 Tax=Fulvivirga marina TaxID=2494733 RepID=A0A937KGL4_9BACT|nr:outer membrane beta-barrel protein [Fulvivirga marina]MBL6449540.1 outer membrane beta-barrel protein [Fulvivirga marina]
MNKKFTLIFAIAACAFSAAMAQDYPYYDKNWKDSVQEESVQKKEKEIEVLQPEKPQSRLDEAGTIRAAINIGVGVMDSPEINNYIRDDLANRSITLLSGSPDMNSVFMIGGQVSYAVRPRLQVKGIFDFAIGISSTELVNQYSYQNDYINYTATRISAGAGANYFFGQRKVSPYVGLALLYHTLAFEGFKGGTVGPRGEAGATFNFSNKFKMEAFLQADVAETKAKNLGQSMTIDFSTLNLGARFLFRLN